MTTDDVFDLLEFAVEPETWQCDDAWEYRAMHWRPNEVSTPGAVAVTGTAHRHDAQTVRA